MSRERPLRVSVSREQSFLGSPQPSDPFDDLQPATQDQVCGDDYDDEAVKVKESDAENHAVLSYAAEEADHMCRGQAVRPDDKAGTQDVSHEPLASITVSTGSFLSYENTDLSLTDPDPFSEYMGHSEQEPVTSKEETDILSSIVPSKQVIYQQQNSSDVYKSPLPAVEEFTPGHTHCEQVIDKDINKATWIPEKTHFQVDFPELEHIFPNLHHQLFKPLEPHPDFDLSSSSSGISQDNRDFYQGSDSSSETPCAGISSRSAVSFTALRRTSLHSFNISVNQQPDPNVAHAAAQSFATETIEGSEQSFQQLLPEFPHRRGASMLICQVFLALNQEILFKA